MRLDRAVAPATCRFGDTPSPLAHLIPKSQQLMYVRGGRLRIVNDSPKEEDEQDHQVVGRAANEWSGPSD